MNNPILDYFFEPGDFALLIGVDAAGTDHTVRVKILGSLMHHGDKYYVIAGPKDQLLEINSILEEDNIDLPPGWAQSLADPDELEICNRTNHLRLI